MNTGELCKILEKEVKSYRLGANESIKRNSHMNQHDGSNMKQENIDAILVDFLNNIAANRGLDLALYTQDIEGV